MGWPGSVSWQVSNTRCRLWPVEARVSPWPIGNPWARSGAVLVSGPGVQHQAISSYLLLPRALAERVSAS